MPGCKAPLLDDLLFLDRQNAGLGRHDDAIVAGDEIAGRTQTVTVKRRADLLAIGKGNGGWAIPWLHQGGMILVERLAFRRHQLVAGPGLRDEHHHGMGKRVSAAHEEFERVVETGGVRLTFIRDRPELGNILAEQRRRD